MIATETLAAVRRAAAAGRPMLLWGTGRLADLVIASLGGSTAFSAAINDLPNRPAVWRGLPVMTSAEALAGAPATPFVVVAAMFLDEIARELQRHGLVREVDWCLAEANDLQQTQALAEEQARWLARTESGPVSRADLSGYSDEFWLWLNLQPPQSAVAGGLVAPLPSDEIQVRLTGTSGLKSLTHGFNQYRLMQQMAGRAGVDWRVARRILDFGSGYGRILRYFAKDAPGAALAGVDVNADFIEWCRAHMPQDEWHLVPSLPPTTVPKARCALVVSFSVFTHLSQASHLAWLEELHGWLEPGGVAVLTLWTHPSTSREYHARHFPDYDGLVAAFEGGEFCYSNLLYGPDATYGEAFVPRSFVERHWTRLFDIVEWLADDPTSPSQTHVAVRKR
jgi:SAM-dependent methyltransferase